MSVWANTCNTYTYLHIHDTFNTETYRHILTILSDTYIYIHIHMYTYRYRCICTAKNKVGRGLFMRAAVAHDLVALLRPGKSAWTGLNWVSPMF